MLHLNGLLEWAVDSWYKILWHFELFLMILLSYLALGPANHWFSSAFPNISSRIHNLVKI